MRYLVFFIIPVCIYFAIIPLREAWGHYYYAINSDPSYLYLFNGLNIATFQPSAHVDNPGTTTQLFSAFVIKATALVNGTDDIQKDIILFPEKYIIIINRALFIVCLMVLFLFGVVSFKYTGSLWLSLFLQSIPFYSWQLMRIFLKVSPEMMIFIACLLWVLTLIRLSSKNDFKENHLKYTVWFALLTAFSLATKLTMIPFILIPLTLMSLRTSVKYLLLSVILFHLFIFPAWEHYDYLIGWIGRLFKHSSLYGSGNPTIVEFPEVLYSFGKLIALEHPFYFVTLLAAISLIIAYKNKSLRTELKHSIDVKILISLLLVVLVQLMMVTKHFNPHYLIPSLTLFTGIIYFSLKVYLYIVTLKPSKYLWTKNSTVKSAVFVLFLILLIIRHSMKLFSSSALGEWVNNMVLSFAPWFVLVVVLFLGISTLLRKRPMARRVFFNISIFSIALIYTIRHADIQGFRNRLNIEATESQAVIKTINEHYSDYTLIYGERSSALFYALKYGANENFPQPLYFNKMKELYKEDAYFWDHSENFKTWTEETTLANILKQHDKVLLECDKRFTPKEKIKELQLTNNINLEEVYSGVFGQLLIITPHQRKPL